MFKHALTVVIIINFLTSWQHLLRWEIKQGVDKNSIMVSYSERSNEVFRYNSKLKFVLSPMETKTITSRSDIFPHKVIDVLDYIER